MTGMLRIGTRGSPLALWQANETARRLAAAFPGLVTEVVPIKTTGDRIQDRNLSEAGGKGLFTKEIEEALLAGAIDVAVHSMKDVPTWLPEGLGIVATLEREDPRDALIARGDATSLASLPRDCTVGSSSLRRAAQLKAKRPDIRVVDFRGNVETRLKKLDDGVADATFLALAGLKRLGREDAVSAVLDPSEMLPAVAQGAIGLEARLADTATRAKLAALDHQATHDAVRAERGLLERLDGSCRTPIGALATIDTGGRLRLDGLVVRPDGTGLLTTFREGNVADAEILGQDAGEELKRRAGPGYFV
ncbi:MAG: hydroxymethylbilane synthase [Tagaea sp.]|nr:hydroxymethylbilane synthase [Tagaea sp.]